MSDSSPRFAARAAVVASLLFVSSLHAQHAAPATQPATQPAAAEPAGESSMLPTWYNYRTRSPRTRRVDSPPDYARPMADILMEYGPEPEPNEPRLDWLLFGIEQQARYELWANDYTANQRERSRFLLRTLGYVGIVKALDPLRFGLEFEDSRAFGNNGPLDPDIEDENDILQAFAELYFPDVGGEGEHLRFQFGRLAYDMVDRRIVGRNRFRNTINGFDGARVRIGDDNSRWMAEAFAYRPVERKIRKLDGPDDERAFYGIWGAWRGWSPDIVLEPFYFVLDEDRRSEGSIDRTTHFIGLHAFGLVRDTSFDYDVSLGYEFGPYGDGYTDAYAVHAELGYTFEQHPWKPRLASWINYATGDKDPFDRDNDRFETPFTPALAFFGFPQYVDWRNSINPALYLGLRPTDKLLVEGVYRVFWVASADDALPRINRRDLTGNANTFVGQQFDVDVVAEICPKLSLDIGYSYFLPGDFIKETGPGPDSHFLYVQARWRL